MAEVFGVPIASRIVPEIYAHVITAVPNGAMVEWLDWTARLFQGGPVLSDGYLLLGEGPRHGLALSPETLRAYPAMTYLPWQWNDLQVDPLTIRSIDRIVNGKSKDAEGA